MPERYDLVVVGSSFASTFFLHEWLRQQPQGRVLVLERGPRRDHAELIAEDGRRALRREAARTFVSGRRDKDWRYAPTFAGTSNIWFGNTPRMFPEDFELKTRYGRGEDWPINYDELEPFYQRAEELMHIAGPDPSPYPRSGPYPQPAHDLSGPDKILQKARPESFFACPTARASQAVEGGRPACCTSFVCNSCPVNAKFTIQNGLLAPFENERVTLKTGAAVQFVDTEGDVAKGVRWVENDGSEGEALADLVALGANALFNPHILLRSGFTDKALGAYLHEQVGRTATIYLDGVDNFDGGTSITGHELMFATGARRKARGAALFETWNIPRLRLTPGKWRQLIRITGVYEDLPQARNKVTIDGRDPTRPRIHWRGHSQYGRRAVNKMEEDIEEVVAPLPVERIEMGKIRRTEGHILGTARMGVDPETSVVDRGLVHHRVRNLLVLGGSAFVTGAPANPSLTIAALSLWAAHQLSAPVAD